MARDMTPVLKRCRSLGIDPIFMGIDKKSNRNARAGRKQSDCLTEIYREAERSAPERRNG